MQAASDTEAEEWLADLKSCTDAFKAAQADWPSRIETVSVTPVSCDKTKYAGWAYKKGGGTAGGWLPPGTSGSASVFKRRYFIVTADGRLNYYKKETDFEKGKQPKGSLYCLGMKVRLTISLSRAQLHPCKEIRETFVSCTGLETAFR